MPTAGASGRVGDTYSLDEFSPVLWNVFGRDSYITGGYNGQVIPTQVYKRENYYRENGDKVPMNEDYYMLNSISVMGNVSIQDGKPISSSVKVKQ